MKYQLLTIISFLTVAWADYNFPSAMPPGGKKPSEVKQIVNFIWDDNAYSGLSKTQYEAKPGDGFSESSFIDGIKPWGSDGPNELDLHPGDIGMSWAIYTLAGNPILPSDWRDDIAYAPNSKVVESGKIWDAGSNWPEKGKAPSTNNSTDDPANKWGWTYVEDVNTTPTRTNPDGTPLHFTFNYISGLSVPIAGPGWETYQSKYGYYVPNEAFYPDGRILHQTISVSWGREMRAYVGGEVKVGTDGEPYYDTAASVTNGAAQGGEIVEVFERTLKLGHEVGNHTIDHMESNSPLPNSKENPYNGNVEGKAYLDGFARWNSEGFDVSKLDTLPWLDENGNQAVGDEAAEFGQKDGNPWQYMGWKMYAGKYISENAWKGAITLAEEELDEYLGISVAKGSVYGFRAPRLEVNSGMHYALKELGYLYDCGQEEGYDYYVDGTNFLWPYTTDNGSPNVTWQRNTGERMSIDSMPPGLWQLPVNAMIVPSNIRAEVWANHAIIARAEAAAKGEPEPTAEDSTYWVETSGKITGFDFNMFILWGMTQDNVVATLQYNLDQRMNGNRAPMHIGCHTDYFTPIYDNATLMNDANKDTYGLSVVNKWNTWEDRIAAWDRFVQYGISKNVYFLSGKETVDYIKSLSANELVGSNLVHPSSWEFFKNENLSSSYSGNLSGQDLENVTISVAAQDSTLGEYPDAGFSWYESAGFFNGLTHISLDYSTTSPLVVRVVLDDGKSYEVWLSSLKNWVKSGLIPLTAFHENQYSPPFSSSSEGVTAYPEIPTDKIIGIEVQVFTSGEESESHTLTLKGMTAYIGKATTIGTKPANMALSRATIQGFTASNLALSVPATGTYDVAIVSASGRMVKSFKNTSLRSGVNNLSLNNLSRGVYMISVIGQNGALRQTMKAMVR